MNSQSINKSSSFIKYLFDLDIAFREKIKYDWLTAQRDVFKHILLIRFQQGPLSHFVSCIKPCWVCSKCIFCKRQIGYTFKKYISFGVSFQQLRTLFRFRKEDDFNRRYIFDFYKLANRGIGQKWSKIYFRRPAIFKPFSVDNRFWHDYYDPIVRNLLTYVRMVFASDPKRNDFWGYIYWVGCHVRGV